MGGGSGDEDRVVMGGGVVMKPGLLWGEEW